MTPIIEARSLAFQYGAYPAIEDLTFEVAAGAIYGLLGPNGAGKSTLLRILSTLLRPSAGDAYVGGCSVRHDAPGVRRQIGYVPERSAVYARLTVRAHLDFYAACQDIHAPARQALVDALLDLFDLDAQRDAPAAALSHGERQRLSLARALAHDPDVLLLDEPTAGLDPQGQREVLSLLHEIHRMGKTIVLASHLLPALAALPATTIGVLRAGRLVASGAPDALAPPPGTRRLRVTVGIQAPVATEARVATQLARARALLRAMPGVALEEARDPHGPAAMDEDARSARPGRAEIDLRCPNDDRAQAALLRALVEGGIAVLTVAERGDALADLYAHAAEETHDAHR
ncbi:MAG: ABC transporter ATP-binding protein [Anaerolineae bacterium]|nr:ABC transporter ATP-binding protein [Anaerolineae bacterium]